MLSVVGDYTISRIIRGRNRRSRLADGQPTSKLRYCPILLRFLAVRPVAGPIGRHGVAVDDPQRLLDDLVGPIDIFEEMAGRRRGQQMRAHLGKEMRRHRDAMGGGERGGALPAGDAADALEVGHHVVGGAGRERRRHAVGASEKFSPIWIGVFSSRTSVA